MPLFSISDFVISMTLLVNGLAIIKPLKPTATTTANLTSAATAVSRGDIGMARGEGGDIELMGVNDEESQQVSENAHLLSTTATATATATTASREHSKFSVSDEDADSSFMERISTLVFRSGCLISVTIA